MTSSSGVCSSDLLRPKLADQEVIQFRWLAINISSGICSAVDWTVSTRFGRQTIPTSPALRGFFGDDKVSVSLEGCLNP